MIRLLPSGHISIGNVVSQNAISPATWHRFAIAVDLTKKDTVEFYVDGNQFCSISSQQDCLTHFALGDSFFLFDEVPMSILVSAIALHDSCLSEDSVCEFGNAVDFCLTDGRSATSLAASLVLMGYPQHWCLKAISLYGCNRSKACDWITRHQKSLMSEDDSNRFKQTVCDIAVIGYSEEAVIAALKKAKNNVRNAISQLLGLDCKAVLQITEEFELSSNKDSTVVTNESPKYVDFEITALIPLFAQKCMHLLLYHSAMLNRNTISIDDFGTKLVFCDFIRAAYFISDGNMRIGQFIQNRIANEFRQQSEARKCTVFRSSVRKTFK
jgi:hypothetical protein